ncbi:MAG TPA: hypothetical protein VIQ29_19435 [Ancylobacter sp.]
MTMITSMSHSFNASAETVLALKRGPGQHGGTLDRRPYPEV